MVDEKVSPKLIEFDEKVSAFEKLIDDITRATPPANRPLHELLMLATASLREIHRLHDEVDKAWADGDQMAWRHYSGKALGSLIMMAGYRLNENKELVPAIDGLPDGDVAVKSVAMLAEKYAEAMTERDRLKRKGKTTT
jgi:hypothetical protein